MIELKEFSFSYDGNGKFAAEDINMTVSDGEFIGITGPSGAGKTTLAMALAGIIPHCVRGDFYGSISVDGKDTVDTSLTELAKLVGSVCQDIDSAMVASVVEDELMYGLENFGVPLQEIEQRVAATLAEVGITELRERNINSLSGGQKQKVAIAAILALKPKILILDEPTGELDPESSRRIFMLLRKLADEGITVIAVEQKIMLLSEFADKIALMDGGRIRAFDETKNILAQSEMLEECGVNCPRVVTLINRLKAEGVQNIGICTSAASAAHMLNGIIAERSGKVGG